MRLLSQHNEGEAWEISLARLNRLRVFEEIKNEDVSINLSPTEPKLDIELRVREKAR